MSPEEVKELILKHVQNINSNNISVYPNPSTGLVQIHYSELEKTSKDGVIILTRSTEAMTFVQVSI